jgi:UDP-glucose 4-epimerase
MELKNLKIMITGAAGFIGSHLADRLAAENELLLLDDFSIGTMDNLTQLKNRSNIRIVEADITDGARMIELAKGIDVVFHLAISCLRTSLNRPMMSHDINSGGTLNVCLAAREHHIQRLIYVSSSEVYGTAIDVPMTESHPCNPITVYGASKLAGELYALACWRTYGLPVIVVRPFNSYGPREPYQGARAEVIPRFLIQLLSGRQPVIYGDGSQTRDFTFVEETAAGIALAGQCDELVGEVVNVAYGREVSISQIAEFLAELTDTAHIGVQRAEPRPGDVYRHFADISKARRLLGLDPKIEIKNGLARYIDWFKAENILAKASDRASALPNW